MTQGPWTNQNPWPQNPQAQQHAWGSGYGQPMPGQPQGWGAPQAPGMQQGWGASPYGQPAAPAWGQQPPRGWAPAPGAPAPQAWQHPQQPADYAAIPVQQGYGRPPYQHPYAQGYPNPGYGLPLPRKRSNAPMIFGVVFLILVLTLGGALVAALMSPDKPGSSKGGGYQNDGYEAPAPSDNPPALPRPPASEWETTLKNNPLYDQDRLIKVRCEGVTPTNPSMSVPELEKKLNDFVGCLMKIWTPPMQAAGFELQRPRLFVYDKPIESPCGPAEMMNAFYCPMDQNIYYATDIIDFLPKYQDTPWNAELIIAHEFGHMVQGRTGIIASKNGQVRNAGTRAEREQITRRSEAQADCASGAWVRAVKEWHAFAPEQLEAFGGMAYEIGGDVLRGKPGQVQDDHGQGATRKKWTENGMGDMVKLTTCNTWVVSEDEVK